MHSQAKSMGAGPEDPSRAAATCIHHLVEAQAVSTPEAVAVAWEDRRLSYHELNARANQVAHHLRRRGVGPEVRVAICMERSLELVVGILGVLKAGGAYVPMDPAAPRERLAFMLEDAGAPLLLTQRRLRAALPAPPARANETGIHPLRGYPAQRSARPRGPAPPLRGSPPPTKGAGTHAVGTASLRAQGPSSEWSAQGRVICLDGDEETIAGESVEAVGSGPAPDNLAYVIYTSGSTGRPKGVLVSHRSLVHSTRARLSYYGHRVHGFLLLSPASFDSSVAGIFWTLCQGGTLVLPSEVAQREVTPLGELISRHQVSHLLCVPAFYSLLCEQVKPEPLASLRSVIVAGEPCLPALVERHHARLAQTDLFNEYGPTEATVWSTVHRCPRQELGAPVPIGRPIPHTRVYLLDRHLQLVLIGETGELFIGGDGVARGYLGRPDLTAEKFIPDPVGEEGGSRLYRTGDLARCLPDGNLEFLGRIDHQVKIRGYRIEPGEIEATLAQHPAVRECVVVDREDHAGDQRLAAYVVSISGQAFAPGDLQRFLKGKLPGYMVPSAFVRLDALPLTPNGKVDRRALPPPSAERSVDAGEEYVAPRDPLEQQLVELWEAALGIRPIGVRDDFFEQGGHSLLAARLFAQIEAKLGKKLPLATLLHAPTIEQVARLLRREDDAASWSSLVPLQAGGSRLPFFCVHGVGGHVFSFRELARHLGPEQPLYGLQAPGTARNEREGGIRTGRITVESLAERYLAEIRRAQPEGPYFLGGFSFGGYIAFEMAQQLHAAGQPVGLLALFDARGPGCPSSFTLAQRVRYHFRTFLPLERKGKWVYLQARARAVAKKLRRRRPAAGDSELASARGERAPGGREREPSRAPGGPGSPAGALLPALREVERAHLQAIRDYVPRVYPGRVVCFWPQECHVGSRFDPRLGWGGLAQGGLEAYAVPGNHDTLLREPNVRVVAEQLARCLRKQQRPDQTRTGEKK